ncbi:MAG: ribonucleoside-diphosphate reductase subunit alpha [Solirubrobacterales bacterium]|nr:ribonucleoside-diphosphate reductase subunit alpha [Solirubrobacterales bacterium]OJU96094.1 MAG: ribonucleoside-diphosphate reductase subunit alpha [Solirubrobacterales bacterium 67-14]
MLIEFDEILHDLELKRAATLPTEELPLAGVAEALAGLETGDGGLTVARPDGERPFSAADAGSLAAAALGTVASARGEEITDAAAARELIHRTTSRVVEQLGRLGAGATVTEADLSSLVEAALIAEGEYEVAKALVIRRTTRSAADAKKGAEIRLIRRSGQVVPWNDEKIEIAVRKAFLSLERDPEPASALAARVTERAKGLGVAYVPIETVQDFVQEELVLAGHMRVAERYIVYRAERGLIRAREKREGETLETPVPIAVTDTNGTTSVWDGEDLRPRIAFASIGLDLPHDQQRIEAELRRGVQPGVSRAELSKLIILNAKSLVEKDSDYSKFAGRILLSYVYEETLDWSITRDGIGHLREAHQKALKPMLEHGAQIKRIDPRLLEFDLDRLADAIDPSADLDFDFLGLQTLYDRYLIIDKTGEKDRRIEAPQLFWMRVAMGVCLPEEGDREQRVLDLYSVYKDRRFCSSTPTLFNAGTLHSQLSSCYLYVVDDTLSSIMQRGIAENAMCSKWAGGLGGSWTKVRGTGSHIESTNGESQGLVPFLKLHNDQLVAVNQGGKRAGSGCAYLETWHNDIGDFLELKRNTGDDRRRTHDMNTANWIPDLFMKRVEARGHWTLFRSSQVPDLHEIYGQEFERRYEEYEAKAEAGEIFGQRIPAIELWKQMLKVLFETGHPWMTFKDACNVRSPQDHAGVIHSSNLCTEITLNTGPDETAVCNLGSVVIDRHLTSEGEIDHEKLKETIRIAVRALDNVIDVNFYPTEAAKTANSRHRPVGLGVMGLQYALYEKGVEFGSPEAVEFNDEMMEAIAFHAYSASSDLAGERGAYQSYEGSKWSRGLLPQDTIDLLEQERGEPVEVPRGGKLDWAPVREKIAAQGMRNSNVIAIAPTATIANIMGTSPCIEPIYKNLFAKSNLSGDFTILNPYLVRELKSAGLWNEDLAGELKYFDGDLTEIQTVPDEIKRRYRTAFQIPSEFLIDAAARRQKWIDQSQSVNLFLAEPDLKSLSHMYRRAWHAGLKTTYYLRTLGASAIEKSTVSKVVAQSEPEAVIEPEEAMGDTTLTPEQMACSVEAARNGEECEACQ